ncbi:biotin--[acetyl-CoA-carboxylase] ligase [Nakamurella deserti]|uniref:biotin--[acetyl-CoA-carboxylase] ligase n=1 Tax=Nakamurella deserti TaxID=2164074 RepID=UPI000DBE9FB6|nr:biotin--[acetyl-CoA-carboxylase] ligase [Nakamurella deserti]
MTPDDDAVAASRRPVDLAAVRDASTARGRWSIRAVAETGSTNDDLAAAARSGAADGTVLISELQRAGKGRLGRTWTAPTGSGLTMSVLLSLPTVPVPRRGWIGALTGLSLAAAVRRVAGVDTSLKWPNDLLVDGAKCAGLLAEATADGVVVGFGLNVTLRREELPRPDATSLLLAGASRWDRAVIAAAVLDDLALRLDRWTAAAGDPDRSGLRDDYRKVCATLGVPVRVELPGGGAVTGVARDVTVDGSLEVDTPTGRRAFAAADVRHLRPGD